MGWMRNEKGFTLLELVLVIVILSVGLAGVLVAYSQGVQDSSYSQNTVVATTLAQDLMEEIRAKCWDETATTVPPCNGAVAPSGIGADGEVRGIYDDVDDFNLLSNNPPLDSQGGAMPAAYNMFTQQVNVCYVAAADLNTCVGGTSRYKRITVTISWGGAGDQIPLVSIASNH